MVRTLLHWNLLCEYTVRSTVLISTASDRHYALAVLNPMKLTMSNLGTRLEILPHDDRDGRNFFPENLNVVINVTTFFAIECRQETPEDPRSEGGNIVVGANFLGSAEGVEELDERTTIPEVPALGWTDIPMTQTLFWEWMVDLCIRPIYEGIIGRTDVSDGATMYRETSVRSDREVSSSELRGSCTDIIGPLSTTRLFEVEVVNATRARGQMNWVVEGRNTGRIIVEFGTWSGGDHI